MMSLSAAGSATVRMSIVVIIGVALTGCVNPPAGPAGTIRVCDTTGCAYRDPAIATPDPREDARTGQQADADIYRGEKLAELQAAAASGDTVANYKLGQAYLYGLGGTPRNPSLAAHSFANAADRGHPWAQYRLAQMLLEGQGVGRDSQRATTLTLAAANGGQPQAACNVGIMYLFGNGMPKDTTEAARWFTLAAENGVAEAQYNLGLLYYRGDGVPQQLYAALQWMRRAAQGGSLAAQAAVGRLYMTGLDTMGQDLQEARTWLTIAAGRGNGNAKRWLAEIDRAEAEEREQGRALQRQAAQTATYLAAAIFAAAIAPPPVYVIRY